MAEESAIRVVVVEDDEDLRNGLCTYLRLTGMSVRPAGSIAGLERALKSEAADVVVLDINLPGESGFSGLERLGLKQRMGVVVLTGRSAGYDRLLGLALGADSYLLKPVDMTELVLVIRNLHARLARGAPVRGWTYDAVRWELTCPNGRSVVLTPQECGLVVRLMAGPGCAVSRADLSAAVQAAGGATPDRTPHVEVLLFRLRRKVEKACDCNLPIQSVRGYGYVFAGDARAGDERAGSGGVVTGEP